MSAGPRRRAAALASFGTHSSIAPALTCRRSPLVSTQRDPRPGGVDLDVEPIDRGPRPVDDDVAGVGLQVDGSRLRAVERDVPGAAFDASLNSVNGSVGR